MGPFTSCPIWYVREALLRPHCKDNWGRRGSGPCHRSRGHFRGRMCTCVMPEHKIFIPVLHLFPDKWTFSCLYSKWKEEIPTVLLHSDPAILSLSSEEGMRVGSPQPDAPSVGSLCTPPARHPWCPLGEPSTVYHPSTVYVPFLCQCPLHRQLCEQHACSSLSSSRRLPSQRWPPVSFCPAKVLFSRHHVPCPLSDFQPSTVDPSGCLGWFLGQPEAVTSFSMCHHHPRLILLWGGRWRHLLVGRECTPVWAGLNGHRQSARTALLGAVGENIFQGNRNVSLSFLFGWVFVGGLGENIYCVSSMGMESVESPGPRGDPACTFPVAGRMDKCAGGLVTWSHHHSAGVSLS